MVCTLHAIEVAVFISPLEIDIGICVTVLVSVLFSASSFVNPNTHFVN